jgi:endonuclease YncB( thermonuclease family)
MKRRFAQAEQQARQAQRGLWSANAVRKPEFPGRSGVSDFPEVLPGSRPAK